MVVNGGFDTDSDWSKGTGWTISGGKAIGTNATGNLQQSISLASGSIYKVSFEVSDYVSGQVRLQTNQQNSVVVSANGTYIEYLTMTTDSSLILNGIDSNPFNGSIDNISVKEVGQNWETDGNNAWYYNDGKFSGVSGTSGKLLQNNTIFNNKLLKVTLTVSNYNDGRVIVDFGTTSAAPIQENGTFTVYGNSDQGSFQVYKNGSFTGNVDNISVKEVQGLDDWILGDTAIYEGDGVRISSDGPTGSFIQQRDITNSSNTYKLTFDVTEVQQSGSIRIGFSGSGVAQQTITQVGEYILYFQPTGTHLDIVRNSSIDVVLDNISLVEVTEATDLPRLDWSGECPVLLLEPQRTNLVEYSEDFSQWLTSTNITLSQSSTPSVQGLSNSYEVQFSGSGFSFFRLSGFSYTGSSALSLFAKKINYRYIGLRNRQGDGEDHTVFDFDTETFTNIANGQTASFQKLSNGWYRITVVNPSPEVNSIVGFAVSDNTGSENISSNGDVFKVLVYGAQLEEGSYATSYIPTRGQAATRAYDFFENTNLGDYLGTGDATFFFNFDFDTPTREGSGLFYRIYSGLDNFAIKGINNTNRDMQLFASQSAGNTFVNNITIDSDAFTSHKIAIRTTGSVIEVFYNGTKITDTMTGTATYAWSQLKVNANNSFLSKTKEITMFAKSLSDNECINLTTI